MKKHLLFCMAAAGSVLLSSCADYNQQGYAMDGRPLNPNYGRSNPTGHHFSHYSYADRATANRIRANNDRSLTSNEWDAARRLNSRGAYVGNVSYNPRDPRNPRSPWSPGGSVVLPGEARRVMYRGNVYYTHNSNWYRPSGSSYVMVSAPY